MTVLDASALLAFLRGEPGADVVEEALVAGAVCGAANWSEVAQRVRGSDRDWTLARALLESYALTVEPVTIDDAEWAAARWRRSDGLSLGDRLCLALGHRRAAEVLTADRAWGDSDGVRQIR
jgi:PIN domain nuclease of toxin-antitoxin system